MGYYTNTNERTAKCLECGYVGSPYAIDLHSCQIQEQGGRCEDYPCCGHTDGDGCQTLPSHTGDYWRELMMSGESRHAFEYGSPEWYDAAEMDERYSAWDDEDDIEYDTREECEADGMHGESGDGTGRPNEYACRYCGDTYTVDDSE